jgi:ribonuclease T2
MDRFRSLALAGFVILSCLAVAPARGQQFAQPGKFDFYLFTLSWSPQFCATAQNDTAECHVPNGNFVVHGLWPEFKNGSWPANCSHDPGPSNPAADADVMPQSLVPHEWESTEPAAGSA